MGQPCPVLPPPDVPHPAAYPLPPSLSLHRIWRLPHLSLCNYLSGTTCETPVTSPLTSPSHPLAGKKISYTHAQRYPHTVLPSVPGGLSSEKESSARASPGLRLPSLWSPTPLSSGPTCVLSLFSLSSSLGGVGGPFWPPRDHG